MKTAVRVVLTGVVGGLAFWASNRVLRSAEGLQQHTLVVGGIIGGLGLLTWAAGRARQIMAARDNPAGSDAPTGVPLFSLQFFGPVVALCGALIAGQGRVQSLYYQLNAKWKAVASRPAHARGSDANRTAEPAAGQAKGTPEPEIKLQGIFFRKSGATAMIDGQTVAVGDWIGGVQVTAIDKKTVTVEMGGTSRVLKLK
ncbi:MAG TPA: hypothetical protein VNO52_10995 [Methylomirabilota bacterium]|nr:hypothetical protein [Methylomirabilota bacterium]